MNSVVEVKTVLDRIMGLMQGHEGMMLNVFTMNAPEFGCVRGERRILEEVGSSFRESLGEVGDW